MPRDYKRKSQRDAEEASSPWQWLAAGFGLGVIAALVLYQQFKPVPGNVTGPKPNIAEPQSTRNDPRINPGIIENTTPSVATPTRSDDQPKPDPKTPRKTLPQPGTPDYDFYRMLPDFEVVVAKAQPNANSNGGSNPPSGGSAKPIEDGVHFLQAGSFRSFADADRRKAQLALKGIESNIHQVTIKEAVWFRVYVGPTRDRKRLERARTTLAHEDIETLLLRVKQ